ncbi:MAG TPA: hypothetical protein PKJ45_00720 [Rubrivivax sp.]|nr:hypothetical protein [Burkholderiales bacterium]MCZ2438992.1 hypothetical protein [Burkholderiales bacterium]HNU09865.1 hypothetical protein [Rubrivivax sp.]
MSLWATLPISSAPVAAKPRVSPGIAWAYDAVAGALRQVRGALRGVLGRAGDEAPLTSDALMVRRMADRLIYSDPSLAADLYAAASRHERFNEEAFRD